MNAIIIGRNHNISTSNRNIRNRMQAIIARRNIQFAPINYYVALLFFIRSFEAMTTRSRNRKIATVNRDRILTYNAFIFSIHNKNTTINHKVVLTHNTIN